MKKRILLGSLVAAMVLGMVTMVAMAEKPTDGDGNYNGNGAPSGPHYNLNLIGVPKKENVDGTNGNGHRIFVKLSGNTKIMLTEGDYAVLDYNGTDGTASFQLPNPDPDNDGVTDYSVFCRVVGTPG
ncbi:MAG: hypothetical protein ACYTAS_09665, partial [Planctomycetota bacterium]